MTKFPSLSPLGRIWLDEIGVLARLETEGTEEECARFITKANAAAAKVEASFDQLKESGDIRQIGRRYRVERLRAKAEGQKFMSWPAYVQKEKEMLVRVMAKTMVVRAGRG